MIVFLPPEKPRRAGNRISPNPLLGGNRTRIAPPLILSTRRQRRILTFANQVIRETPANIGV
jgi:hypothetical protein